MQNTELRRRARPVLDALRTLALQGRTPVLGLRKKSCPYHSWDTVQEDPATAPGWTPFAPGDAIGGVEAHCCFRGGITAPAGSAGRHLVCLVSTGATDIWNNNNPQFLAYLMVRWSAGWMSTTPSLTCPPPLPRARPGSWRSCTPTATPRLRTSF